MSQVGCRVTGEPHRCKVPADMSELTQACKSPSRSDCSFRQCEHCRRRSHLLLRRYRPNLAGCQTCICTRPPRERRLSASRTAPQRRRRVHSIFYRGATHPPVTSKVPLWLLHATVIAVSVAVSDVDALQDTKGLQSVARAIASGSSAVAPPQVSSSIEYTAAVEALSNRHLLGLSRFIIQVAFRVRKEDCSVEDCSSLMCHQPATGERKIAPITGAMQLQFAVMTATAAVDTDAIG